MLVLDINKIYIFVCATFKEEKLNDSWAKTQL